MENNVLDLSTIEVNKLPELQGWKERQETLVSENPFIEIVDNKTFEAGKRSRTNLLKGRTSLQGQEKLIVSKITAFRNNVGEVTKELIDITLPHEEKQQAEVKRYEIKKAKEKAEKERKEQERKENILKEIEKVISEWKTKVKNLKFSDLNNFSFTDLDEYDADQFEEFKFPFLKGIEDIKSTYKDKREELERLENQRLEDERLKKERAQLEEQKRVLAEKEAKAKAEREAEEKRIEQERKEKQALIDAENRRKADVLAKQEAKLKQEREAIEKEKAEKLAKEQAEQKAKEQAELKAKEESRIKALAPDREKLINYVNSLKFTDEVPVLKNKEFKEYINSLIKSLDEFKSIELININKVK